MRPRQVSPNLVEDVGLGRLVSPLVGHPAAAGFARTVWGGALTGLSLGIPQRNDGPGFGALARPDDAVVELVRLPQSGSRRIALAVPRREAARVVDLVLGGDGQLAHALSLRDAEQGVLAYIVARACAELGLPYQVCEVQLADGWRGGAAFRGGVVWGVALETPLGCIDLRLSLSPEEAEATAGPYPCFISVRDRVAPHDLEALSPSDLLWSDAWPLTLTTRGLVGPVEVSVAGSAARMKAVLDGRELHVTGAAPPLGPDEVELTIAEDCLSFAQLGALARGAARTLPEVPSATAALMRAGRELARGTLVMHRGALGLRVSQRA
jgi:hypothetical protein